MCTRCAHDRRVFRARLVHKENFTQGLSQARYNRAKICRQLDRAHQNIPIERSYVQYLIHKKIDHVHYSSRAWADIYVQILPTYSL